MHKCSYRTITTPHSIKISTIAKTKIIMLPIILRIKEANFKIKPIKDIPTIPIKIQPKITI